MRYPSQDSPVDLNSTFGLYNTVGIYRTATTCNGFSSVVNLGWILVSKPVKLSLFNACDFLRFRLGFSRGCSPAPSPSPAAPSPAASPATPAAFPACPTVSSPSPSAHEYPHLTTPPAASGPRSPFPATGSCSSKSSTASPPSAPSRSRACSASGAGPSHAPESPARGPLICWLFRFAAASGFP